MFASRGSRKIEDAWQTWKAQLRREKQINDPAWQIHSRVRGAIRFAMKKKGVSIEYSSTFEALGYSKKQLVSHLERQFLPGMGWHNKAKWHIDHIVPLAHFKCQSLDDPAFKAAWALTNLRPLWAKENIRKGAKREFLL